MKLTVFTPTYDRAHLLGRLYESLLKQSVSDFEWVVVDDGSSDNTRALVEKWETDGRLDIRYEYQAHGGKHRAVNRGLDLARGELFMIVDSDDWLLDNAVETVLNNTGVLENEGIIGLQFRMKSPNGDLIGDPLKQSPLVTTQIELREKMLVKGDMVGAFRTDLFRDRYRFPEFAGEDFLPEALVWNRMAEDTKWVVIDIPVYVACYQPDGLSATIVSRRRNAPQGVMTYYSELTHNKNIPFFRRCRAAINFWRFARKGEKWGNPVRVIGMYWAWLKPVGEFIKVVED